MQPTPLRGHKIVAFLKAGFGPTVFPIYRGGAADGPRVGPPITTSFLSTALRFA
jgi:hypothetical protein